MIIQQKEQKYCSNQAGTHHVSWSYTRPMYGFMPEAEAFALSIPNINLALSIPNISPRPWNWPHARTKKYRRLEAVASLKKDSYQRWDPAPLTKFWKMWKPSNHKRCILAEGAIALSVTLSGGALFASWKLLQFPSSLIVKIILAIFMRASAQQILQPSCALQSILTDLHLLH